MRCAPTGTRSKVDVAKGADVALLAVRLCLSCGWPHGAQRWRWLRRSRGGGQKFGENPTLLRYQGDTGLAFDDLLNLENLKHGSFNFRVGCDSVQRLADNARSHGGGFGELDGSLALGGAGDDADLVGAILLDGRGHLT